MDKFPWDDDAITGSAQNATNELPCSMSARELGALGLPVDDPFWDDARSLRRASCRG